QAVLRHKARLHAELQRVKIMRGVQSNSQLAQGVDPRTGSFTRPLNLRIPTLCFMKKESHDTFASIRFRGQPKMLSNSFFPKALNLHSRLMIGIHSGVFAFSVQTFGLVLKQERLLEGRSHC